MSPYASVLAPSLLPSSLVHLSFPASLTRKGKQPARPVVREYGYELSRDEQQDDMWEEIGLIKRIDVGKGVDGQLAVADSNYRITVSTLPQSTASSSKPTSTADGVTVQDMATEEVSEEVNDEEADVEPMSIKHQFLVKPGRTGDNWVGLNMMNNGVLSTLKSGNLNYHPLSPSTSTSSRTLPSGINSLRLIPSTSSTSDDATHFAAAGKDFEVSLWDVEKTLNGAPLPGDKGGKRKKGNGKEMEIGEVWRARNMPNNNLGVPTAIHHTCLTPLTSSSSSSSSPSQPGLATGTLSGHVRRYDTRQRKAVSNWKVAREGGMGVVEQGEEEFELFFADRSSFLGSLDLRTGKILYSYSSQTSTPLSILPLHHTTSLRDRAGLVTLSSDATIRLCSTSGLPKEEKGNVKRGEILTSVGGVGLGGMAFVGWEERDDGDELDEEAGGSDAEDEEADVWGDMGVIENDESDESETEEVPVAKRTKGKRAN